jgi:hypothetical protein
MVGLSEKEKERAMSKITMFFVVEFAVFAGALTLVIIHAHTVAAAAGL